MTKLFVTALTVACLAMPAISVAKGGNDVLYGGLGDDRSPDDADVNPVVNSYKTSDVNPLVNATQIRVIKDGGDDLLLGNEDDTAALGRTNRPVQPL